MTTKTINRWFTESGKAKRIPAKFERYKQLAVENKEKILTGDMIHITKIFKLQGHSLSDSLACAVAFIGMYNNTPVLFTKERYEQGCKLLGVE